MSKENIQAFFAKAQIDARLQGGIAEIYQQSAQSFAELSVKEGTPFTAEEFLKATSKNQLSDDDLKAVAGGATLQYQMQTF